MVSFALKWASKRFLSEYLEAIDDIEISLHIFQGKIGIRNLSLKRDLFKEIESPFVVHNSLIDEVSVNIPWKKLSSEASTISVKNIFLLLRRKNEGPHDIPFEDRKILIEKTKKLILQVIKLIGKDSVPKLSENEYYGLRSSEDIDVFHQKLLKSNEKGFLSKFINRIIDNAIIEVENIHIRYEDEMSNQSNPFSVGVTLDSVQVYPTINNEKTFFAEYEDSVERTIDIKNLAVYLNSFNEDHIFTKQSDSSQFTDNMKSMIYKDDNTSTKDIFANISDENAINDNSYVLSPLSFNGTLTLNRTNTILKPNVDLSLDLKQIDLNLNRDQYSRALDLVSSYNKYYRTISYGYYSAPKKRPSESPDEWWKYIIRCVKTRIHDNHNKNSIESLVKRVNYVNIHRKMTYSGNITKDEKQMLDEYDNTYSIPRIIENRKISKMSVEKDIIEGNVKKLSFIEKLDSKIKIGAIASILLLINVILGPYIGLPIAMAILGGMYYKKYFDMILNKIPDIETLNQIDDNLAKISRIIEVNESGESEYHKVLKTKRVLLGNIDENSFHQLFEDYITEQIAKSNEYVKFNSKLNLGLVGLTIEQDKSNQLLKVEIDHIHQSSIMRVSSSSFAASIKDIHVKELITSKESWNDILAKRKMKVMRLPSDQIETEIEQKEERMFVSSLFEINPHDKNDVDIFVRLETSRFDITLNKRYVDGIIPFFIPSYKNANEIKDVTQAGVKYAVRTAEESVKKAIRDKKRILLDIVVPGPKIHVPKLDDKNGLINNLVLSSGRLEVKSNPKSVMHSSEDLTHGSFYDKYNINLYDINCTIKKSKKLNDEIIRSKMILLHDFGVQCEANVCIVGNDEMPKIKIDVGMKKMFLSVSKNRIEAILDILKSQLTQPVAPIEDEELRTKPPANKLNTIDKDIRRHFELETQNKVTHVPFSSIMVLHAWIGYIAIELIEDRIPNIKGKKVTPSMMSLLEVCLSNFHANAEITTHYNNMSLDLSNFMIAEYISTNYHNKNKVEKNNDQLNIQKRMALKVEELDKIIEDKNDSSITSDIDENILEQSVKNYILRCTDKHNLIKIDISNIPAHSPKYKQIDNTVSVRVGDIEINVIRQAIAYLLLHVKKLMKTLERKKFKTSSPPPRLEPKENIVKKQIEESEALTPKDPVVTKPQYKPNQYLAEVILELSKINICLNKEGRTFTSVFVENIEVGCSVRSDSSLSVTGCLHKFGINHIASTKVIHPILQIKSEKAVQFTFAIINPYADDYTDHDIAVSLVVDVLDFIFINKIIQELVLYGNQFVVMIQKVDEILESNAPLTEKDKKKSMKKIKSQKVIGRDKLDKFRRKTLSSAQGEEVKRKMNEMNPLEALDNEINEILKDRKDKVTESDSESTQKSKKRKSRRLSRTMSTPKDKHKRKSSNTDKPQKAIKKQDQPSAPTKSPKIKLNINVESPRVIVPKSLDSPDQEYLALSLGKILISNQFRNSDVDGLFDDMKVDISDFNLHVYDKDHGVDVSMIDDFLCSIKVSRVLEQRNKEIPKINVNVNLDPFIFHLSQVHAKTIAHILVHNLKEAFHDKDLVDLQSYFQVKKSIQPLKVPSKKNKRKSEIIKLEETESKEIFAYNVDEYNDELLTSLDKFGSLKQEEDSEENIRCSVNIEAIHFHLEDKDDVILSLSMHQLQTNVSILDNQSMFVGLTIDNLSMKDHMNENNESFNYLITKEKSDKILSILFNKYSNNNKEISCTWSNTNFLFIDETFVGILKRWKPTIQECLNEMRSNMTEYEAVHNNDITESATTVVPPPSTATFTKVSLFINDIKFYILEDRSKPTSDAISLNMSDTSFVLLLNDLNQHIISKFQMDGLSFKKSKLDHKDYKQTKVEHIMYPFNLGILFFMKDGIDVLLNLTEFNFIVSYKDLILIKDAVENRLIPLSKELSFENGAIEKSPSGSHLATPADDQTSLFKKITIHTQFSSILIGLIDDRFVNDFFLPLLRFKIGTIDLSVIINSMTSQLVKIDIKEVDAGSFNNNMSGWEPIIEPYHCNINMKKDNNDIAVELNSLEALNFNLTGDLINTCFNTLDIVDPRKKYDTSTFNESYPVLIRNRVGRKIDVDVILGDENLLSSSIDDLNDLPIMLNRNDRLSGVRDDFYYKLRVLIEQQSNSANFIHFNKVDKIIMPYNVGGTNLNYLCEIELVKGTRVITFHGGIKFINNTSYDMHLHLYNEGRKNELKKSNSIKQKDKGHSRESSLINESTTEPDHQFTVKKNDYFFIPILKDNIRTCSVQVDGFQVSNPLKVGDEDISNFTFICNSTDSKDNKIWVCNSSLRLSKNNFDYIITFEPKITVENLMTVPVDIMVGLKGNNQSAEATELSKQELKKMEKEKKKREKLLKKRKSKKSNKDNKLNDDETASEEDEESFSFDVKSSEGNLLHPQVKASKDLDIYIFNNFDERLSLSLKIDQFRWSSYLRILEKSNKSGKFALQNVEDPQHVLKLNGDVSISETGRRKVRIYSLYWIINDSGLDLLYASSKDSKALKLYDDNTDGEISYETGDQRKWYTEDFLKDETPCSYFYYGEKKLYLKVKNSTWSKQVTLGTRDEGLVTIDDQESHRKYVFLIKYEPAPSKFWRTTIISIVPAYWVHNKSKHDIHIEQFGSSNTYQKVRKNKLIPYHFPDYKKASEVTFSVGEKSIYSNPVSVNIVGRFPLKIQKTNSHEYYFFTLKIIKETGSATEIVIEDDFEESYYKITNNTKYDVVIRENKSEQTLIVKSRKSVPFSFSHPQETKKVVYLKFLGEKVKENDNEWVKVNIGKVSEFDPASVGKDKVNMQTVSKGRLIELILTLRYQKKKKHKKSSSSELSVTEDEMFDISESEGTITTQDETSSNLSLTVQLNVASVGISLIDNTPQEVMYIYLSNIDIFYKLDNEEQSLEAKMSFQIDNSLYSTPYPIIFHQSNLKDEPPLIHFAFYKDERYKNIACFRYLAFKMNEIDFKVDEAFLMYLLYWSTTIVDNIAKLNPLYVIEQDVINEKYRNSKRPVLNRDDEPEQAQGLFNEFFFETFHLNPIHINVSFSPSNNYDQPHLEEGIADLFNRIMNLVTAIDRAPIRLSGLLLKNSFTTKEEFSSRVIDHYTTMFIRQAFAVLGSTDFLGNPVSLISSLGTGAYEFVHEPASGMVASPKEFGKGLAKGTSSLVKNTLGGVLNSAQKIVGSVGNLGAKITFDQEYKKEREVQKLKKAKHFGEGIGFGLKEFGTGLYKGVTGLITQPVKSVQKEGVKGLGKGVAKGLVGAVLKPTVGVVDLVSRTTEGIKNTAYIMDGETMRVRFPRNISNHLLISPYDPVKSEGQFLLKTIAKGKYRHEFYVYHKQLDKKCVLLVSSTHIMVIKLSNLEKIKIADKWSIHWRVKLIKLSDESMEKVSGKKSISILIKESKESSTTDDKAKVYKIKCKDEETAEEVYDKVQSFIKYAYLSGGSVQKKTNLFKTKSKKKIKARKSTDLETSITQEEK